MGTFYNALRFTTKPFKRSLHFSSSKKSWKAHTPNKYHDGIIINLNYNCFNSTILQSPINKYNYQLKDNNKGIIHLVSTKFFPENWNILPPDTYKSACQGVKMLVFGKFCVCTNDHWRPWNNAHGHCICVFIVNFNHSLSGVKIVL